MKTPKSTQARLLKQKRYREKHREKVLEYGRKYRKKNREKINAYFQKWREDNAEKYRAYQKKLANEPSAKEEMNTPLPPSPDLPQWAYWLLFPIVLLLAAAWHFITSGEREAKYTRRQRNKPTNYVRLYSKTKRKRE